MCTGFVFVKHHRVPILKLLDHITTSVLQLYTQMSSVLFQSHQIVVFATLSRFMMIFQKDCPFLRALCLLRKYKKLAETHHFRSKQKLFSK